MQNLDSARRSKEMSVASMGEAEGREEGDEGDDEFESDDIESGYERGKRAKKN